jgi:pimeloyl-ACP methyl ester carboxylesterase
MRTTTLTRNPILGAVLVVFASASPITAQGRAATINGVQLHYEVEGQGEPLVLIHGWALDLRMWDPQVRAFGRRFKVIRYDRRGFAKSGGSEDLTWDAADLAALLDSLGVTRAHILGMSQGARVALHFVRDHPERVASLTLQSASPPEKFPLVWNGADAPRFDEWAKLVQEKGLDAFRPVWAQHPLMRVPADRPEAKRRLDVMLAGYRGARFLHPAQPSGPGAPSAFEDLPRITVPTLVITSDGEVPFLQLVARTYAYYIPNARFEVIPGGGHMVNLIEPDRFNGIVMRFLGSLVASHK